MKSYFKKTEENEEIEIEEYKEIEIEEIEEYDAAEEEEIEEYDAVEEEEIEGYGAAEEEEIEGYDDAEEEETEEFEMMEVDDSEYFARYEQRQRIRLERQQRMQRRRVMKRFLYLGGLAAVIVMIIAVKAVVGRTKEEDVQEQLQTINTVEKTDTLQMENGEPSEADREAETDGAEPDREQPVCSFAATPDTAGIYSEEVISTNAILIDESTDTIVASKGADERIYPASMTKVLTVLVAAERIAEEDLDDLFTITLEITDYAYVNDCSAVGFLDGEEVTVRDLFYGTVLPSGGDAALGLAIYIAGSQEAFVEMMNAKLEELGLGDSAHFTNCIGLYDEEHYCSVYDMAVIMKAAVQNELCREILSAHTYTTSSTEEHPDGIIISNWFLRRIEDKDTGGEVLCAKTGFVVESKNCAVSYGTFAGGTPYICVTAGSTSSWRCIYDHVEIYNRYVPAVRQ